MAGGGTNTSFPTVLPVFVGKNFEQRGVKMQVIFSFQKVMEVVKVGFQEPAANATEVQLNTHRNVKKKDGDSDSEQVLLMVTNLPLN